MTRTSLSRSSSPFSSLALFALSCPVSRTFWALSFASFSFLVRHFLRSCSLAELAKAIVLPSGDQTGLPAPFGRLVSATASPPRVEMSWIWEPSFAAERTKATREPSGDQRGDESCGPLVNGRGGSLPS